MPVEKQIYTTDSSTLGPSHNTTVLSSAPAQSVIASVDIQVTFGFLKTVTTGIPGSAAISLFYGIQNYDHGGSPATVSSANYASATWFDAGRLIPHAMSDTIATIGAASLERYQVSARHTWKGYHPLGGAAADMSVSLNWEGSAFWGVSAPFCLMVRVNYYEP